MFSRIKELSDRYEELMQLLQAPDAASDPVRFQNLMKEQSELLPIVESWRAYQAVKDKVSAFALPEDAIKRMMAFMSADDASTASRICLLVGRSL